MMLHVKLQFKVKVTVTVTVTIEQKVHSSNWHYAGEKTSLDKMIHINPTPVFITGKGSPFNPHLNLNIEEEKIIQFLKDDFL